MARIEMIPDDSWDGELGDPTHRRVDNILAVHSLNPRSMAAHQGLYESAMAGTATLRKVERELIALVVSLTNHCHWPTAGAVCAGEAL
jgi:alkylhydroperoxidase family enzyme